MLQGLLSEQALDRYKQGHFSSRSEPGREMTRVMLGVGRSASSGDGQDVLAIVVVGLKHVSADLQVQEEAAFPRALDGLVPTRMLHFLILMNVGVKQGPLMRQSAIAM